MIKIHTHTCPTCGIVDECIPLPDGFHTCRNCDCRWNNDGKVYGHGGEIS